MFKKSEYDYLRKLFNKYDDFIEDNILVEKNWRDYRIEFSAELEKLKREQRCDNYKIFDFGNDGDYRLHTIVATYKDRTYCLIVKELFVYYGTKLK